MMEIKEGMKAPDFEVMSDKNKTVRLSDFLGKRVLLYFYPKDNTPGCSLEAKNFNDNLKKLATDNIVVLGVSRDSVESHCKFRDKYELEFDLLADTESDIVNKYGVLKEKVNFGNKYFGIERASFAIDEKGYIQKAWREVKAGEHIAEVLEHYGID